MLGLITTVADEPEFALCIQASDIFKFIGYVLLVFKIAIPLLIIAFGMFDFGKAVTAGKDDEIKKSAKTLLFRAIAGVIIFFIPAIVLWLFGAISGYNEAIENADNNKINWKYCQACMLHPGGSECSAANFGRVQSNK